MERKIYKPGEVIIKQGDLGSNAYHILKGEVEIYFTKGNERNSLARLGEGEIFGEMGMLEDKPRSASVAAVVPTEVEIVTPKEFNELILNNPRQLIPFLQSFFERLRRANEKTQPSMTPPNVRPSPQAIPAPAPVQAEAGTLQMIPQSDLARQRMGKADVVLRKFPYRIGRWSETADVFVSNDLLIKDIAPHLLSRNHCAIERQGDMFIVHDRGSAYGTRVNTTQIGGLVTQMSAPLHRGENELQLGGFESPYLFKIIVC